MNPGQMWLLMYERLPPFLRERVDDERWDFLVLPGEPAWTVEIANSEGWRASFTVDPKGEIPKLAALASEAAWRLSLDAGKP